MTALPATGGPAFPAEVDGSGGFVQVGHMRFKEPGMSLRDFFAATALPSVLESGNDTPLDEMRRACAKHGCGTSVDALAALRSYQIADAMLAQRAQATPT